MNCWVNAEMLVSAEILVLTMALLRIYRAGNSLGVRKRKRVSRGIQSCYAAIKRVNREFRGKHGERGFTQGVLTHSSLVEGVQTGGGD